MVRAQFDEKCCITGLPVKELLVASHIVPWARDEKNRTDTPAAPRFFRDYEGRQITLPRRFLPDQDLLEYHRENVFRG